MTKHSFLTALSPIEFRHNDPEDREANILEAISEHEQDNSPFKACPMVHMARLQILDQLTPPMGDTSGARLKTKYLLFVVDLDGGTDDLLDCLYRTAPGFVHAVWGRCLGYPAYKGSVFFRRYIARCMFSNPLGYAGFPLSVQETLQKLARKQAMADWATRHQGLSDADLRAAWQRDHEALANPDVPKPGNF
ncbi:hypothetical protein [Kordiimonas sp.]|uniref:hypothetical protein n=1 Tax=Kordiimonas sp. TaxID=1970157 RepID=UPI003A90393C